MDAKSAASIWSLPALEDEGACAVCNTITKNRCTACKMVFYCTTDHQKSHWKSDHKEKCGPLELVKHPKIGRHYIARRRIEPGEIVLRETEALVTFINGVTHPICMNCYGDLRGGDANICHICHWWLLCSSCIEHGPECNFTVKYGKFKLSQTVEMQWLDNFYTNMGCFKFESVRAVHWLGVTRLDNPQDLPDKGEADRYNWDLQHSMIGLVRVLALRESNPRAYAKFMDHEDHHDAIKAMHGDALDTDIAKHVLKFFNVEEVDLEEMSKISRILVISGFGVKDECTYFAEKTSYFEHSCRPNCAKTLPDKNGGFVVWAVEPINAGEHVTISYNLELVGTMKRKNWLASTKFFNCTCSRCVDPTEFGTMFNAFKCIQGRCKGDLLPISFEAVNGIYPDYVCQVPECNASFPSRFIDLLETDIKRELSTIQKNDLEGFRDFVIKHLNVLHKNHYYMLEAKLKLADMLGFRPLSSADLSRVPIEVLNDRIKISEEIAKILRLIATGNTRFRGRLLYGVVIALHEKCKRVKNDLAELIALRSKLISTLKETCQLLCYESEESSEGQIAKAAMKQLSFVEKIVL